jgi:hypothetical protein
MTDLTRDPGRWPLATGIGWGTPYDDATLDVPCGSCKADPGSPCRTPRGAVKLYPHTTRTDKASNLRLRTTAALSSRMETAALRDDPDGPLWWFSTVGHFCGTHGAHHLLACTPAGGGR